MMAKMIKHFSLVIILLLFCCAACRESAPREAGPTPPAIALQPSPSPQTNAPVIVAFGDSLTSGYGLSRAQSYPSLVQERLRADGYEYRVVNEGVTGDTSAAALHRLDRSLEGDVKIVIVELGGNDILRGQPVAETKKNLGQIIERIQARKVEVLLAGLYAPDSSPPAYQKEVREAYRELARKYKVVFIPFLLDRVAGLKLLNLEDGLHPNAEGTKIMAETVYRALRPMLKKQKQAAPKGT